MPYNKKEIEIKQNTVQFAKDRGDKIQEAKANIELGDAYLDVSQEQNAIECYQNAKKIAQELGDKCQEGDAYLGIGNAYRNADQHQTAMEYYQKTREIAQERGDKRQEGEAYLQIGNAYRGVDQYQTAIEYFQKAKEIAQERGDKCQEGKAYIEIGDAYHGVDQHQTAIEYFQKASEIAQEKEEAYLGIRHAYRVARQHQTSNEYLQKASGISVPQGDKQKKEIFLGLGYDKARKRAGDPGVEDPDNQDTVVTKRPRRSNETETEVMPRIADPDDQDTIVTKRPRRSNETETEVMPRMADPDDQDTIVTKSPRRSKETETEVVPRIPDDWFVRTMLNDHDFCLKDEHEEFLISLDWIHSFGITGKNKNIDKAHLVITTEPEPPKRNDWKEVLQERFGDEIKDLVEFIEGKKSTKFSFHINTKENNVSTNRTTSPPTSGDAIYIQKDISECYGSLGIFVKDSANSVHAVTNYHVLYNGKQLPDDCHYRDCFTQLQSDCENTRSKTSQTSYCFRSKADEGNGKMDGNSPGFLGSFHKGIYNDMHDLGLVKVGNGVKYNSSIPDIVENDLTEKAVLNKKILSGIYPTVRKIGFSSGSTTGTLKEASFCHKFPGTRDFFVKNAYMVKVEKNDRAFIEEGDSGSLVVWNDKNDEKRPFAYCCMTKSATGNLTHEDEYICFSLIDSLKACGERFIPSVA